MILRKLHTHDCHHNPDGLEVPGPHMHFPSTRYPMAQVHKGWAYPFPNLPYHSDLSDFMVAFCIDLGIDPEGLQYGFDGRRR